MALLFLIKCELFKFAKKYDYITFFTDNTGDDDMSLDDANFILLNQLKKPVKEQDKALILKGS